MRLENIKEWNEEPQFCYDGKENFKNVDNVRPYHKFLLFEKDPESEEEYFLLGKLTNMHFKFSPYVLLAEKWYIPDRIMDSSFFMYKFQMVMVLVQLCPNTS